MSEVMMLILDSFGTCAEVMKGLVAKEEAKMRKNGIGLADSEALNDAEKFATRSQQDIKTHQVITN